jgi:acyl carrier protein
MTDREPTQLEQDLARIWQDVLGVPSIGVNDDFFDLGGHSLMALELASRVRKSLGVDSFPIDVAETPTVASMSEAIVAALHDRSRSGTPT